MFKEQELEIFDEQEFSTVVYLKGCTNCFSISKMRKDNIEAMHFRASGRVG